jgi:hypothetical protein
MAAQVASRNERGCPLANAAVDLPEKDHPARRVIEAFKTAQRERLIQVCTCTAGAGIWRWASNVSGDPDVVMASSAKQTG